MAASPIKNDAYTARFHESMSSITEALWNAHNPNHYPFLSHAFLYALETSGSVGREAGMLPMYMEVQQNSKTVGFIPLYLNFTVTANIFLIGSGPAARKRQASITTPSSWWDTLYTSGWTSTINEGAPLRSSRCTLQMFADNTTSAVTFCIASRKRLASSVNMDLSNAKPINTIFLIKL